MTTTDEADSTGSAEVHEVLVFNLNHDLLVRFLSDGSCTLAQVIEDDSLVEPLTLDPKSQLLLLDALCHIFNFQSPIADIVTKQQVGEQEDVVSAEADEVEADPED